MELLAPPLDAPIPGQSLTAELGGRPWQKPPQYATPEQALEHYIPRLTDPEVYDQLLDVLELGIPAMTIAETMQLGGVMEGLHSIDVGILILPVLVELIAYIGDDAGIDYKLGIEKRVDDDKISDTKIALAMKRLREEAPEAVEEAKEEAVELLQEEEPIEARGLMGRRV